MKDVGVPAVKDDRVYRYGDYKGWPEDERWELIDGEAWDMSPAPSTAHQAIVVKLIQLVGGTPVRPGCHLFAAPFDVLLPDLPGQADDDVVNVVQPDLVVVCDPAKIKPHGCVGAPDWVVEILSPYTSRRDLAVKYALYERHGVKEYWVIDPGNRFIHVYLRGGDGRFCTPRIFVGKTSVTSTVLADLAVNLEELFAAIPA